MRIVPARSRSLRKRFGPGRSAFLRKRNLPDQNSANIWYQYSGRLRRDVLIAGDPQFEHFCWLEGEESIREYELSPTLVSYADGEQTKQAQVAARVVRIDSTSELHDVCSEDGAVRARVVEAISAAGF